MRIQGAKKVHYDAGPNMTPLVDVVMVILIFLMLAGSFDAQEHYLVSNMPIRKLGTGAPTTVAPTVDDPPMNIFVDPDASGGFKARVGDDRNAAPESDPDRLTALIRGKKAAMNRAGIATDKIQVVIVPSRAVKYKYVIEVYEAAMRAEFTKIAFAQSR